MEERKIKLNLGCGIIYKPGYLNVDKFNNAVADKICDVQDLPFKSNSVEKIESLHLIEHFDYIHCKYLLSEWFRVLKPRGILIIETPDLEKTFKKFSQSALEIKKTTLQWIYGIDSAGMQHKTGFDWELIRDLLREIGFENIRREEAISHLNEPGMRIVCQKPKNFSNSQLRACFRKRLKEELEIEDSYLLLPLENWIRELLDIYSKEFKGNKEGCLNKIIAKSSICNPIIPKIFLKELFKFKLIEKDKIENDLINYLIKIEFHKKLFSLWKKRKKTIEDDIGEIFKNFIEDLTLLIRQCLINKDYQERLNYIASLYPEDIKIFDFQVILIKAREFFNQGVKEFYKRNFPEALNLFLESVKINPKNPLSYWNMARLKIILNCEREKIENDYKNAMFLTLNKNIKNEIKLELNNFSNKRLNLVPKHPIPEDYQENIL